MPAGKEPYPLLSASLHRLLKDVKCPSEFYDFCSNKKIFDILDLALLSPDVAGVDAKLLALCRGHVTGIGDVEVDGPIRKAWWLAHKSAINGKEIFNDEVMDEGKALTLDGTWQHLHQMVLIPQHRVGEKLMAQLAAIANANPPKFPIIPIDKITIESEPVSASATNVKVKGKNLAADPEEFLYTKDNEIIKRKMKALLTSFAYVSILNRNWFSLQHAEEACLWINEKITESDQSALSVTFFKNAYSDTMRAWQTSVCVYKMTLGEAVRDRSSWLSNWNYTRPSGPSDGDTWPKGAGKGKNNNFPSNRSLKRMVNDAQFRAMERFSRGNGKGNNFGGKGNYGPQRPYVQQNPLYAKPWGGKGDPKGKSKGKTKKGDGKGKKGKW